MADQFGCDLFMNEQNNETDFHDDDDSPEEVDCGDTEDNQLTQLFIETHAMLSVIIEHFNLSKKVDERLAEAEREGSQLQ